MTALTVREARLRTSLSRLAHFTPARNLWHIAEDGFIRSSKDLADNAPEYFDPTDRQRIDQHPEMVCCSFEYPNGYYLAQARAKSSYVNYRDWICLLLDVDLIERPGVLFSGCNAAKSGGAYLSAGGQALLDCYADPSVPAGWPRRPGHLPGAATDVQAETLVPGPIDLTLVRAVVVKDEATALNLYSILQRAGFTSVRFNWIVAPIFFERDRLSSSIRYGRPIVETPWHPPMMTDAL